MHRAALSPREGRLDSTASNILTTEVWKARWLLLTYLSRVKPIVEAQ